MRSMSIDKLADLSHLLSHSFTRPRERKIRGDKGNT